MVGKLKQLVKVSNENVNGKVNSKSVLFLPTAIILIVLCVVNISTFN